MFRPEQRVLPPKVMVLDWHGTLVDTHDAMFSAMEDMLPQLEELGLVEQLLPEGACRTEDDARLVRDIRIYRRLHPRILAERRVSRTDIFNAIFGDNVPAKRIAHHAYNQAYRKYFGQVKPFQPGAREYLSALKAAGIKLAVSTNRNREFLDKELQILDDGRWLDLFDATVCADDVTEYKPDPQVILKALVLACEIGPPQGAIRRSGGTGIVSSFNVCSISRPRISTPSRPLFGSARGTGKLTVSW